jgi:hypothetical protein
MDGGGMEKQFSRKEPPTPRRILVVHRFWLFRYSSIVYVRMYFLLFSRI